MKQTLASAFLSALPLLGCGEIDRRILVAESAGLQTAVVASVDLETREVILRDDTDGSTFTVTAGPEVRNLPQLAAGDRVDVEYVPSFALAMSAQGSSGGPVTSDVPLPRRTAETASTMVVVLLSYDYMGGAGGDAYFRTRDGFTRWVNVSFEIRDFLAGRTPGESLLVTMTEPDAVSIIEVAAN